jgi:hypothetical protein
MPDENKMPFVYEASPKAGAQNDPSKQPISKNVLSFLDVDLTNSTGGQDATIAGPMGEPTVKLDRDLFDEHVANTKKKIAQKKITRSQRAVSSVKGKLSRSKTMRGRLDRDEGLPEMREERDKALVKRQIKDETSFSNMRTKLANIEKRKADLQREFAEKEVALEDAALKASEESRQKLANISNKLSAIRAQNPSEEIFGGTWGVAAMLLGSLRQGLYGGKNEAVAILNRKVTEAAKYQLSQIQNMKELKKENRDALQAILDESENDKERLENTKSAILDEIKASSKQIVEQYKIDIDRPHLAELLDAVLDSKNKVIDDQVSDNQAVLGAEVELVKSEMEVSRLKEEADQLNSPIPSEEDIRQEYDRAYKGNDAVAKTVRKSLDVIRATSAIVDKYKSANLEEGVLDRFLTAGMKYVPSFLLNERASELRIADSLANLQLTSVLRAAGEGGKMSDKDKELVKHYASDPITFRPVMERRLNEIITGAESDLRMSITNAADRNVFTTRVAMRAVYENMPRAGQYRSQQTYSDELDKIRGYMSKLGYKRPTPTGAKMDPANVDIIFNP